MPDRTLVDLAGNPLRSANPKPNTRERGLPGPINAGLPGAMFGTADGSYFLDSREYAADLRWTGAYSGSTLVYSRMETDTQLTGLMIVNTLPVRRFRWEFDPNGARPTVVNHVADNHGLPIRGNEETTRRRSGFKHDRHMAYAFRALVFGHYHFEELYEYREDGLLHLSKLGTRPPTTIQNFIVDDHGELEAIEQVPALRGSLASLAQGFQATPIPETALLSYVWNPGDDGDVVGRSMLRSSYRSWLAKDALIRIDVVKNERNGMGMPWFEVDPAASPEQIEALAAIARSVRAGEDGGAAGPGKLSLVGTTGQTPDTIGSIRYHDQQMSRTFSAMWMDLGSSETGARALGETLMEATLEAQGAIAEWYAECLQAQIDREVLYNWGPDEQAPLITFTRLETAELALKELVLGVEKGLIEVDPELRAAVEERWKVPGQKAAAQRELEQREAEDQAAEAEGRDPRLPAPPPALPAPSGEGDGGSPAEGVEARKRADTAPARTALARRLLEVLPPEGATWPALCRLAGTDRRNGTARRARAALLAEGAIVDAGGTLRHPADLARLTLPTGRELRREVADFERTAGVDFASLEQTYVTARQTLVDAIRGAQEPQIAELAAAAEAAAGDAGALASIDAAPIDPDLIAGFLRATAAAGVESARLEHANQIGSAEPLAAAGGDGLEVNERDLEARVRGEAEARSATLVNGLSLSAQRRAGSLAALEAAEAGTAVREHLEGLTGAYVEGEAGGATQAAFNYGRFAYFREAPFKTLYSSELLDANTCSPCASVDGTEYLTLGDAERDYPGGGYDSCAGGDRCRGTIVAIY